MNVESETSKESPTTDDHEAQDKKFTIFPGWGVRLPREKYLEIRRLILRLEELKRSKRAALKQTHEYDSMNYSEGAGCSLEDVMNADQEMGVLVRMIKSGYNVAETNAVINDLIADGLINC